VGTDCHTWGNVVTVDDHTVMSGDTLEWTGTERGHSLRLHYGPNTVPDVLVGHAELDCRGLGLYANSLLSEPYPRSGRMPAFDFCLADTNKVPIVVRVLPPAFHSRVTQEHIL
jgi:hypothetical protein